MKKKDDPRHQMRVKTVQSLFESSFREDIAKDPTLPVEEIKSNLPQIDKIIEKNAPAWPISQIAPLDLATLRLAIWELKFKNKKEPQKAVIDEAVEIAKEFGSQSSAAFVNGVLGSVLKKGKE